MSTLRVNKLENTNTSNGGISIDTSGHVTIDGQQLPSAGPLSNRNLIINGAMQVAQRGTSVSAHTGGGYHTLDRWNLFQNLGAMNLSQDSDSPPGFSYSLKHEVDTTGSFAATSIVTSVQGVEGYNTAQLDWGTSSAKSVTVSFWVKSSVIGTYGAWMRNADANRYQPKEFSVSSTDWEHKTLTFTGDTSGTWGTTNGVGINFGIALAAGSTNQGTADTWQTGPAYTTSNQVNWQGTSGATFYITGVQLEVGETATPFEHRSYGDELAKCQRYYQVIANVASDLIGVFSKYSTNNNYIFIDLPVEMRVQPQLDTNISSYSNALRLYGSGTNAEGNNLTLDGDSSPRRLRLNSSTDSGSFSAGSGGWARIHNSSAYVNVTAEL